MNQSKTTAKDFFLYVGIMIGLYVSSISFLMLIFQIINKVFPIAGDYTGGIEGTIRSVVAALIIFFPAFMYLSWLANKDLKLSPEKKEMWVRRWLIFLTLFLSGLAIAIDLVTLIYRFLGAEDLTLRFFLKVFVLLAVVIAIFRYCLYDFRRDIAEYSKSVKTSIYVVSIIVLAGVIGGVFIIGSPSAQRAKMMDERRVSDLMNIQSQIVYTQYQNKADIPDNLSALNDPISNYVVPKDPETATNYEYKKISKNSFELCATFKTKSDVNSPTPVPTYPAQSVNENWQHDIGRVCFERTIDTSMFKAIPAIPKI
jgi:hypothetical protein